MRNKVAKAIRKAVRAENPEGGKYMTLESGQIIHTFNHLYRKVKKEWKKHITMN